MLAKKGTLFARGLNLQMFLSPAGVELSSKERKLEWGTDDTDDDIDVEKTLELRQVRAYCCKN